jgi:hypothetical protein
MAVFKRSTMALTFKMCLPWRGPTSASTGAAYRGFFVVRRGSTAAARLCERHLVLAGKHCAIIRLIWITENASQSRRTNGVASRAFEARE